MTASLAAGLSYGTARAGTAGCCPIVELRQYTLKPGRRDDLINLFEQEFIEPHEAIGLTLIGQFRDLDKPDRFVWVRGFADMPTRRRALTDFYSGPVWKTHRNAANDTMIDVANVLLLHPVGTGFALPAKREPFSAGKSGKGIVIATIYAFAEPVTEAFVTFFDREIAPAYGAAIRAKLATEHSPNNFPALPVRENENVFVWFSTFESLEAYDSHRQTLAGSKQWQDVSARLRKRLTGEPETLRLAPTLRSLLHG